ncbi:MAG: 3-hydroxyacyl-CoA dehydrogenase family protein [Chloroflexi bacterium]|nr:3-hydroxyacyl-CoA dehydrogenase family protein [Chloroflexota bacterium]
MQLSEVQRIGVLGGGVMGGGIAHVCAVAGYDVLVRDLNETLIAATRETVFDGKWGIKRAVERGKLDFDEALAAMERISFTTETADLAGSDIVIEAIPEELELKQETFKDLDGIVKPEAIFASNTSGFVIGEIARDVSAARKTRFAGMHFSNPVSVMKMCEVIYTPETSAETVATVRELGEKVGKDVSMVKDAPETYGFLLNRIFAAARREAHQIVEEGIATPEDVDKAMIGGRNWPAGFFGSRGGIGKQW